MCVRPCVHVEKALRKEQEAVLVSVCKCAGKERKGVCHYWLLLRVGRSLACTDVTSVPSSGSLSSKTTALCMPCKCAEASVSLSSLLCALSSRMLTDSKRLPLLDCTQRQGLCELEGGHACQPHGERERSRERSRDRDRETERQRERQTHSLTHTPHPNTAARTSVASSFMM